MPGTLSAFVVCTSSGSHIGGTIGGSVQPGSEGATRDRCGSPTVATGVGWRSAPGMYISAAGVFGNRTAVEANNEDTVSHDLFLTQMCAEGAHSQHTGSRVVLQQYQTAAATVSCLPGRRSAHRRRGVTGYRSYLVASAGTADGRGWEVRATNTTAYPRPVFAQVICTRP
ncbi:MULTISPECIES: hypothetical protein [unclassified Streptomyces]|uniref:hypothetical protein n=1 Tax=unclassified Streptomyces TaxID=2593676 RepID=UPI000DC77FD8|nr:MULTISPECIES: hypothetical protein [unclassified Streptomyces]AWZ08842.1 hypothetical protein DRB89_34695 [Streptomyces sp. ICC4]